MKKRSNIIIIVCILWPLFLAGAEAPSLKSQAIKASAQLPMRQIKQKLHLLPVDLYVDLAQEIILNNKELSPWQMNDILLTMRSLMHQSILKPKPDDVIKLNMFIAALTGDKQDIASLLDKIPVNLFLTCAFALVFKNETVSIQDKIALLNAMLANNAFKQLPESVIVKFFVRFLGLYQSFSQPKNVLVQQNVNTVIDARDIGEGAVTVLQEAFYDKNPLAIHFLLERGADPNLTYDDRLQTVSYAAKFGMNDVLRDLLAHGGKIQLESQSDTPYYDPLYRAAENGHEKTVQLLIEKGGRINKIFHTWNWGQGTLLDQAIGMRKENTSDRRDIDQAITLLRKNGALTLEEIERKK